MANVDDVLRAMSVEQKVGQLFVAPVGRHSPNALRLPPDQRTGGVGQDPPDQVRDWVRTYHVGGVCYFATSPDGDDAADVARLLDELAAAVPAGGVPLLFGVDQEGGTVARLRRGVTQIPGAMALAATGDPKAVEEAARIVGTELRALGFHQNYAPSADVNVDPANPVIGVRSFGSDAATAAGYVGAYVRGMRAGGVACAVKHFPGHGDTSVDSHLALPTVTHDERQLAEVDLPPFAAAIEAGTESVMTAHLRVPALDDTGAPATCSSRVLVDLLRGRLGFTGCVVTDALDMAGARATYGDDEVAVRALLAGADQLLMPADLPGAFGAVLAAVGEGRVPASRLDEAVRRTLELKERLGVLDGARDEPGVPDVVAHGETVRRVALAGLTVLGDAEALRLTAYAPDRIALVGPLGPLGRALAGELGVRADLQVDTGSDPEGDAVAASVSAAADADMVVAVTADASRWAGQRALLAALDAGGVPYVHVATRVPYDAGCSRTARARLLTYGDGGASVGAALAVLTGRAAATGRLPVDVPAPDGAVAYPREVA